MTSVFVLGETTPNTTLGTIIVVTGAFLCLMLLLKKFAWSAISDLLKQREERIANDLDSAEQSRIAATKMERERQEKLQRSKFEAAEIIKDATESGEKKQQKILETTQSEVVSLKEKATQDLLNEREEALDQLKEDVGEISLKIAEKILSKELTVEAHEALINACIEGLGTSNEAK